ncbi:MAG: FKBP-type peptidyl-prolyl cis-trans isomerase [Flavobacteriales bacterium]|nr:FKBP-type peptidyl-prolyl cis-trans isomerase [Flavobacteriales bacterium]
MKIYILLVGLWFFNSCDTQGVKSNQDQEKEVTSRDEVVKEVDSKRSLLDDVSKVIDEVTLDNGIVIKWVEHGEGEFLKRGEIINIDYKVFLKDNKVVDGNHLLKKESMPFMIGFQMQTKGWDIALEHLKIGDFAEVFIPSELARGEKGIEGLIPPNADNVLKIRILSKQKPTRQVDGNKVYLFEENEKNTFKFDRNNKIIFHCMVSSPTNPMYVNTYRSNPFELKLNDSGTVPGLKKALINAKKSDRMFVYVPAEEAYGSKGYLDVVGANEDLFYNILVMDVIDK